MKRSNEFSIGEAIDAFLKERGLKTESEVQRVIGEWPRIMGKAISENTEKIWFREGIFYIKMKTPIWKSELLMARSKIKDMLNREFGKDMVTEVRVF